MLVERAYRQFSSRSIAKAAVLGGVSLITLTLSALLRYMNTEQGSSVIVHIVLLAASAALMCTGAWFLKKARQYRSKAKEMSDMFCMQGRES